MIYNSSHQYLCDRTPLVPSNPRFDSTSRNLAFSQEIELVHQALCLLRFRMIDVQVLMASNYVDTTVEEGRFHGYGHSHNTSPTSAAASPKTMRRSWSSGHSNGHAAPNPKRVWRRRLTPVPSSAGSTAPAPTATATRLPLSHRPPAPDPRRRPPTPSRRSDAGTDISGIKKRKPNKKRRGRNIKGNKA
jgi:hypothetical protein